jgi:hypothetical protein
VLDHCLVEKQIIGWRIAAEYCGRHAG